MTDEFKDKQYEDTLLTDALVLFAKELNVPVKLDYYSDHESNELSKFKIELKLERDQFNNRVQYSKMLTDKLQKWGLEEKRDKVFIRSKISEMDDNSE